MNLTILYYTSNQENPAFEQKIIDNLKKQAGDIPIISISHKPIDLGKNICIGEKPVCYSNSFKQILIGLKEAKTDFCISAESDVLYPPEYFQFIPPVKDQVYRYDNVWLHFDGRHKFYKKGTSEGAQICGREHWIKSIEKILENDSWEPEEFKFIFPKHTPTWTGNPAISFRTRKGIGFKTGYQKDVTATELPYWGTETLIFNKYLNETI